MSENGEDGIRTVPMATAPVMGFLATLLLLTAATAFFGAVMLALVAVVYLGYSKAGIIGGTLGAALVISIYVLGDFESLFAFGGCVLILFSMYIPVIILKKLGGS